MNLITHHQPEGPDLNRPIRPNPHTSLYDLSPCAEPLMHWRTMTAFLLAFAVATHVRRTSHLKQTLASARKWAAVAPSHCSKDYVLELTRRFHSFTPYVFTSHEACFFRSLVLLKFLSLMGISANWEFGVRPLPFSAHCWIEHDGIVLNDHLGHVSEYRKIMSV
ncbi:MAG: lasso peptide biosynthesis B2 protein [Alphaproteobacteria bacterium]|nr:lasso peptide biosynthesis B2 protein [Alphaproteobacteria bacterium]